MKWVHSGEKSWSRWSAKRLHVTLRKNHSLPCQRINVGSNDVSISESNIIETWKNVTPFVKVSYNKDTFYLLLNYMYTCTVKPVLMTTCEQGSDWIQPKKFLFLFSLNNLQLTMATFWFQGLLLHTDLTYYKLYHIITWFSSMGVYH